MILILEAQVSYQYELLYRPGAVKEEEQDGEATEECWELPI